LVDFLLVWIYNDHDSVGACGLQVPRSLRWGSVYKKNLWIHKKDL